MKKRTIKSQTRLFIIFLLLGGIVHFSEGSGYQIIDTLLFSVLYAMYSGLILFWIKSVYNRLLPSRTRRFMIAESVYMFLLLTMRTIKYRISGDPAIERMCWYIYYIPFIMMPTLFLVCSLSITEYKQSDTHTLKKTLTHPLVLVGSFLAILVLTNDIHHLAFIPKYGYENFNGKSGTYEYGVLIYVVYTWIITVMVISILFLIKINRILGSWKKGLLVLIPFALYPILAGLNYYLEEKIGTCFYNIPDLWIFCMLAVFEVCIRNGLIPVNEDYSGFFENMNIPAIITDKKFKSVYKTSIEFNATEEQLKKALTGTEYLDEDHSLHGMHIPGGYAFWVEDESELNQMNQQLEEANETIGLENKLIQYETEQKEERSRIDARNKIYRRAADSVYDQQKEIKEILDKLQPGTPEFRNNVARISILNAFVKRKSNFVLTYGKDESISIHELYLAIEEMIRFMGFFGVLGSVEKFGNGSFKYEDALELYNTFEMMVELILLDISKLLIVITDEGLRVTIDYEKDLDIPDSKLNISCEREGNLLFITATV